MLAWILCRVYLYYTGEFYREQVTIMHKRDAKVHLLKLSCLGFTALSRPHQLYVCASARGFSYNRVCIG